MHPLPLPLSLPALRTAYSPPSPPLTLPTYTLLRSKPRLDPCTDLGLGWHKGLLYPYSTLPLLYSTLLVSRNTRDPICFPLLYSTLFETRTRIHVLEEQRSTIKLKGYYLHPMFMA